jgi:hypothetical protein
MQYEQLQNWHFLEANFQNKGSVKGCPFETPDLKQKTGLCITRTRAAAM